MRKGTSTSSYEKQVHMGCACLRGQPLNGQILNRSGSQALVLQAKEEVGRGTGPQANEPCDCNARAQ
jgi:hypothetical protein